MELFREVLNPWGQEILIGVSWVLLYAAIIAGTAFIIGHAVYAGFIAKSMKWSIDPTWGVNLTKRMESAKPPTMLDLPTTFAFEAVNLPDPQNPVGSRGIGEPPVGAGAGALICAIEDAMGGAHPTHQPVTPDKILSILELGCLPCGRLETHV